MSTILSNILSNLSPNHKFSEYEKLREKIYKQYVIHVGKYNQTSDMLWPDTDKYFYLLYRKKLWLIKLNLKNTTTS